jgi:hypothetical protein
VEDSVVNCKLNGLCHEYYPFQVPACLEAIEPYNNDKKNEAKKTTTMNSNHTVKTASFSKKEDCGDSFWSACDYNCDYQQFVSSIDMNVHKEVSWLTHEYHVDDACG